MKIVISGLGDTGFYLAQILIRDGHDLILIERNAAAVRNAKEKIDAKVVEGDGSNALTLEPIIDETTDLFVAVTDQDNANIIGTMIARKFGARRAIVRINDPNNLIHPLLTEDPQVSCLNADMIVSKDLTRLVGNPSADEIELFSHGKAEMLRLHMSKESPIAGQRLKEVNLPDSWLIVAAIRDKQFSIASGDMILEAGDQVLVIGNPKHQKQIEELLGLNPIKVRRVIMIGYNEISTKVSVALRARHIEVRLIEQYKDRAENAAANLDGVMVFHGDGTSEDVLAQAGIEQADYLLALTDDDETNILISLLAKEKGVTRVVAITHKPHYTPIIEKIGIDGVVNPRTAMVDEIIHCLHHHELSGYNLLEGGEGHMMEFVIKENSRVVDMPLEKIKLPKQTLIGAIVRGDDVIIPRGDAAIKPGDHVVVFSASSALTEVKKFFSNGHPGGNSRWSFKK